MKELSVEAETERDLKESWYTACRDSAMLLEEKRGRKEEGDRNEMVSEEREFTRARRGTEDEGEEDSRLWMSRIVTRGLI